MVKLPFTQLLGDHKASSNRASPGIKSLAAQADRTKRSPGKASCESRAGFRPTVPAWRKKSGYQVHILGKIKAGDEMGSMCARLWEAVVFGMEGLKSSQGVWGRCAALLLLWLSCSIAQVTAKGSEKEGKNGKVKGGEASSFMSEQCQAAGEREMM